VLLSLPDVPFHHRPVHDRHFTRILGGGGARRSGGGEAKGATSAPRSGGPTRRELKGAEVPHRPEPSRRTPARGYYAIEGYGKLSLGHVKTTGLPRPLTSDPRGCGGMIRVQAGFARLQLPPRINHPSRAGAGVLKTAVLAPSAAVAGEMSSSLSTAPRRHPEGGEAPDVSRRLGHPIKARTWSRTQSRAWARRCFLYWRPQETAFLVFATNMDLSGPNSWLKIIMKRFVPALHDGYPA
jgi:hypothetical protein